MMAADESFHSKVSSDKSEAVVDDDMRYNYEIKRIQSFQSWPVHYPIDPACLAKSGFYYQGKADEVTCFSCKGQIKDWQFGDIVQKKHSELFPHCNFIKKISNNIPANHSKVNSNENTSKFTANLKSQYNTKAVMVDNNSSSLAILNGMKDSANIKCWIPNFEKLKSESERQKTFTDKWPLLFMNIAEIVKAGFFYLGYEDKVQCPFCKGIVSNWENGDIALEEHAKHFPWCDYLQSIGYSHTKNKNLWYKKSGYDICGSGKDNSFLNVSTRKCKLLDQQSTNLKKLGVHLYKGPIHPQQASLAARIRSFREWSANAPVAKGDLANAGFFYIGISDHTKCFHCDGGLCNWEQGDNPWIEHARWFSQCDFVRLNKGEEFIDSCKENCFTFAHLINEISDTTTENPCSSSESLMAKADEAMKSSLITHVLESNIFPPNIVKVAVLKQIKETDSSFSNVDEICKQIAYLTEEMENEPFKMSNVPISMRNVVLNVSCSNDVMTEVKFLPEAGIYGQSGNGEEVIKHSEGTSLEEENRLLKDQCLCKVCMDKEVGIVFLPCGHLLACTICAPALKICPMCRKTIEATVRAYLP